MNYAIIAAGEGSRLIREGFRAPKPLVELNGIALIDRLIAIFRKNNASSISVIVNEEMSEVKAHIEQLKADFPLNLIVRSTISSMHSFFELSRFLPEGKFCLTTVDTVFDETEFAAFIQAFEQDTENDGMMGVTNYVDDEKPLYVSVDDERMITGFWDMPVADGKYISGGIYGLTAPRAIQTLKRCIEEGQLHLRNYQRQLIADGMKLKAYPFKKIIDVDHVTDIKKAEELIENPYIRLKIAGVRRAEHYSPNHVENDSAIFNLTVSQLKKQNCEVTEYSELEFLQSEIEADVIFAMARNRQTILKLQDLERKGKRVINSGFGIENCTCERMTELLSKNRIPLPENRIIQTNNPSPLRLDPLRRYWVKKGGFYARYKNVTYAENEADILKIIHEYAALDIPVAVLHEHLKGDLIKFYGVKGTGFFYWFYPNDLNHSKFGLEEINGKATGIPFDIDYLKKICNDSADILGVSIYGGDCVVDTTGNIRIIDFNDWPSYAPCRITAAVHIAQCIYDLATKTNI